MRFQHIVKGLILVLLCGFTWSAYAHKVNVFAYVEGDQIYVQGYFSDGTKAKNSVVTVYGGGDQALTKGQTDEEGAFTFPSQGKQPLRIVLNAGQGHQASYQIPLDELTGITAATSSSSDPPPASAGASTPLEQVVAKRDEDPSRINEAMMRQAVAQGVLPLAREISELKERRSFSDIVGGIGLIVGLLGVFAYVKARQETRRLKKQ